MAEIVQGLKTKSIGEMDDEGLIRPKFFSPDLKLNPRVALG
jgi:hypothetical protein